MRLAGHKSIANTLIYTQLSESEDERACVFLNCALNAVATGLRKSLEAVRKKIDGLGLEVVVVKGLRTTTSLKILEELSGRAHVCYQIRFVNCSMFRSRLLALLFISQAGNHMIKERLACALAKIGS